MIQVEHLTRCYGELTAVNDVSFHIGQGEVMGLLCHKSAGKTTIMKLLTGFLEPTAGTIRVDNPRIGEDTRANGAGKPDVKASWRVDGAGQGEVVNPAGVQDLTGKLARQRIGAVPGTVSKPQYGLDKPALALSVTRKGGEQRVYRPGPHQQGGLWRAQAFGPPRVFPGVGLHRRRAGQGGRPDAAGTSGARPGTRCEYACRAVGEWQARRVAGAWFESGHSWPGCHGSAGCQQGCFLNDASIGGSLD